MNLPDKIKLGFQTFEIRYENRLCVGPGLLTHMSPSEDYVVIQESLPVYKKAKIIFQAAHGLICNNAVSDMEDSARHRIINVMYAVIRDNPCLVSILRTTDLPLAVLILGDHWQVVKGPGHDPNLGSSVHANMELHLNTAQNYANQRLTLFHEIYHVIFREMDYEEDERQIELLAWFFTQLLFDNDISWVNNCDPEEV